MPAGQNLFAHKIKLKLKAITILCDRLILRVVEILIFGQCQMLLMSKGIKFLAWKQGKVFATESGLHSWFLSPWIKCVMATTTIVHIVKLW